MYQPKYFITNLILEYIVKTELSVADIKRKPLPIKTLSEFKVKQKVSDLVTFGELLGLDIGFQQALNLITGKIPIQRLGNKYLILNNYKAFLEYLENYDNIKNTSITNANIIHINSLIMKKVVEDWEMGKFRSIDEKPNELFDNWYKFRNYLQTEDLYRYFDEIFTCINSNKNRTHRLISLAIFTYEFIDRAPMLAGNMTTAIAFINLFTKHYGFNDSNIICASRIVKLIDTNLDELMKLVKEQSNLTMFIEVFLYSLSVEVLNTKLEYDTMFEKNVSRVSTLSLQFNDRQIKILDYLRFNKKVSRSEYTKMMGISFMSSYRDLKELMDKGYLIANGTGRATYYTLSPKNEQNGD